MPTLFLPLVLAVIALSTQLTTALRDGLTAQVPILPTVSASVRPWLSAAVGALAAFCGALGAGAATGGITEATLIAAATAAVGNLAIVLPKLIYTESNAAQVAKNGAAK